MAEILPFAASGLKRARHRGEGGAEIVIFPGIRVEYHDAPPTPPAKQRRRKRNAATGALTA